MRWALRVTTLDQHHVGSHRADHGPKHEPGEDFISKDHETAAMNNRTLTCNKDRRRKLLLSANSGRQITIDAHGPVTEVLSLKILPEFQDARFEDFVPDGKLMIPARNFEKLRIRYQG